jgi:hypothetical protein
MTARLLQIKLSSSSVYYSYIKFHFNFPHHASSEVKFSLEGNYIALNCRKWDEVATCDLNRFYSDKYKIRLERLEFGNAWLSVWQPVAGHVKGNVFNL